MRAERFFVRRKKLGAAGELDAHPLVCYRSVKPAPPLVSHPLFLLLEPSLHALLSHLACLESAVFSLASLSGAAMAFFLLAAGCASPQDSATAAARSSEQAALRSDMTEPNADTWQVLFNGTAESLSDHWRGFKRQDVPEGWRVEDSTLTLDPDAGDGGDLITKDTYDDFELKLDWKISEGGNSGVIYNVSEDYDAPWHSGPEMQLLDNERHPDREKPSHRAGANYDLQAPEPEDAVKPAGQWNAARIVVRGDQVEHWLNGEEVVAYEFGSDDWNEQLAASKFADMPGYAQDARGHIALQDHGDRVWFRNIEIRPLGAESSE